ncbi:MAG: hypothetical protein LCH67_00915 [Bacteroidetes bacterium]|nr:hypothetical protein [Bacteroidota bacterium]
MLNFKYLILLPIIISAFACDSFEKKTEKFEEISLNGLYTFAQTSDPNLCNPDSIVGSDCAGGLFYFSENNKVIYTFLCLGSDVTSYELGTYEIINSEIRCEFTKIFELPIDIEIDLKNLKADGRVIELVKSDIKIIKPTKCDVFPYSFSFSFQDEEQLNYVLKKENSDTNKDLIEGFQQVEVMRDFL